MKYFAVYGIVFLILIPAMMVWVENLHNQRVDQDWNVAVEAARKQKTCLPEGTVAFIKVPQPRSYWFKSDQLPRIVSLGHELDVLSIDHYYMRWQRGGVSLMWEGHEIGTCPVYSPGGGSEF